MRAVPTWTSTPLPSSVHPDTEDSSLFEGPSSKHQHLDTSQQSQTNSSKKMNQKALLRPVSRPKLKICAAPHSLAPFKMEVPKWSVYFSTDSFFTPPLPSKEEKIFHTEIKTQKNALPAKAAHPVAQAHYRPQWFPQFNVAPFSAPPATPLNTEREPVKVIQMHLERQDLNKTGSVWLRPEIDLYIKVHHQSSLHLHRLSANCDTQRSLFYREKDKWCVAPVKISDKFSPLDDHKSHMSQKHWL